MNFVLLFAWALSIAFASAGESKSEKYPYGLITPGYGIVTEDDLAYDALHRETKPYDPTDNLGPLRWQCFATKDVDAKYKSWRGPDGMGAWNKIYTMCTLEISIRHRGELHLYGDRRAHQLGYCRDFMRSWKWITNGQEFVCLNGDGGGFEQNAEDGKYKSWTWEKFKTPKGCYSYFAGECDTRAAPRADALNRRLPGNGIDYSDNDPANFHQTAFRDISRHLASIHDISFRL